MSPVFRTPLRTRVLTLPDCNGHRLIRFGRHIFPQVLPHGRQRWRPRPRTESAPEYVPEGLSWRYGHRALVGMKSDAHRLDVHNGLLLSDLWDAGFDAGLISFDDDGRPLCSLALTPSAPEYVPEGLLGVTVIDPACGSGHFLLAAAGR